MWPYLPGSLVLLPFFQKDFLEASTLAIFVWATSPDTPSPVKILDVYIPILWLLPCKINRDVMNNHVIHSCLRRCASCFARALAGRAAAIRKARGSEGVHQCSVEQNFTKLQRFELHFFQRCLFPQAQEVMQGDWPYMVHCFLPTRVAVLSLWFCKLVVHKTWFGYGVILHNYCLVGWPLSVLCCVWGSAYGRIVRIDKLSFTKSWAWLACNLKNKKSCGTTGIG